MKDKFETGLEVAGGFDQEFKKPAWFNQRLFDEGRQECVGYLCVLKNCSMVLIILTLKDWSTVVRQIKKLWKLLVSQKFRQNFIILGLLI